MILALIDETLPLQFAPEVIDDVITIKNFFGHNLGRSFHIWGQIEAVFNISKFSKWPPFWARQTFLPEVISEEEYTRKIAMSISGISAAAEVPAKFQSDWKSLNPNLAASRLHEILP